MSTPEPVEISSGAGIQYWFKRYRLILTGISFALLLLMPSLDQVFSLSVGFESTEKRILASIPTFRFPHVKTFIAEFNQYYKENFGWRNALYYQYSQWKYWVVGVSPLPSKVILGKHGWFYPGNSIDNVADQHKGLASMTPAEIEAIGSHLSDYQRELAKQGIKLYVFVAPDSYSIYPEFLPDNFHISAEPSNLDRLKQYMAEKTTIPFIDPRPDLIRAKATYVLYQQTDTHWNSCGALIATIPLLKRMRHDFPSIPLVQLTNYRIRPRKGIGGDLVTVLALNRQFADSVDYDIKPAPLILANEAESIPHPGTDLPEQRFLHPDKTRPKVFLLGDSFSYVMNPIAGYFREMYVVRASHPNKEQVRKEHPDIMILEIVERNLSHLASL
ncbi:MAG: hypothetical protein H7319_05940 [Spirosoma sp.]|nr:hypothetical protein [Spirosoma sp.]